MGKTVSLSDLESLYGNLPPQIRNSPEAIFRYYGFLDKMAAKGEANKLYEQSPYKEKLEAFRKQTLAEGVMQQFVNDVDISETELKDYFDKHKGEFDIAKVQALLIPINSKAEEASATAKAAQVAPQLKDGTKIAILFAQYPANLSEVRKSDATVPAAVRKAVFALKPDEVSAPIVEPGGVYVTRLDKVTIVDYATAKPYVRKTIADAKLQAFLEEVQKSVTVTPVKDARRKLTDPGGEGGRRGQKLAGLHLESRTVRKPAGHEKDDGDDEGQHRQSGDAIDQKSAQAWLGFPPSLPCRSALGDQMTTCIHGLSRVSLRDRNENPLPPGFRTITAQYTLCHLLATNAWWTAVYNRLHAAMVAFVVVRTAFDSARARRFGK